MPWILLLRIAWGTLAALPGGARGLDIVPSQVALAGPESRAQLLISAQDEAGNPVDLTLDPTLVCESLDSRVVRVEPGGRLVPGGPGETEISIRSGTRRATVRVVVEDFQRRRPTRFASEVVPIFSRRGCNAGSCHGKASGQNGFRLSLLGSDPRLDFESLTRDARGRRVFPAAPAASLVLLKATAILPHGGGRRFEVGSAEYQTLARWIGQGTPFDLEQEPALSAIIVEPTRRRVGRRQAQQLRVTAVDSDGEVTDVTHLAQFQSNAPDLATVDDRGRVEVLDGVGEAAIMARFGGRVAIARLTIPSGREWTASEAPSSRNLIDPLVHAKLHELGIPESPECTDSEFARRSALDICGILPAPADVAEFEASRDPEKRLRWVERLVERPEYADRFALLWSAILRNKRSLGSLSQPGTFAFHSWIRQSLAENKPYDRFVSEILTARGDPAINPPVVWYRHAATLEEQADDTAQLFLGMRLQCARCHHHPSERWSQDDYYGFAAHFSRVGRKPGSDPVTPRIFVLPKGAASDPLTGKTYAPRVLGGQHRARSDVERDPRQDLAEWLRRPDNPLFARAIVNRYWKHFLGRGLVEPEDDMRDSNPPSNPELLDALAADFIAHGFDLKWLVRTIATSRAYERSSLPVPGNERDSRNFARFSARRLPAEVLLDAIDAVTGVPTVFDGLPRGFHATQLPDDGFSSTFLDVFGRPKRETVCECERSSEANLSQSLVLLNDSELQRKLHDENGRAAGWARDIRADRETIDELYRLAFGRLPSAEERDVCLAHLSRRRREGRVREGYEDLIWTILNTKEFLFNH